METLKTTKIFSVYFGVNSNPVIANGKYPIRFSFRCFNMDFQRHLTPKFQSVSDEVLKELNHLNFVGQDYRERRMGDSRVAFCYQGFGAVIEVFRKTPSKLTGFLSGALRSI